MEGLNIKEIKPPTAEKIPDVTEVDMEGQATDLPDWIKPLGNDMYEVTTRKGKYILEDVEYEKIMRAKQRTTGGKTSPAALDNFEIAMISESMVKPKLTDMEIRKLKSSEFMRLRGAIYKLYDIESFLSA